MAEITTGTKVLYKNIRRGEVRSIIHGEITHVYHPDTYATPCVIVKMTDGPMAGEEKDFAIRDLEIDA